MSDDVGNEWRRAMIAELRSMIRHVNQPRCTGGERMRDVAKDGGSAFPATVKVGIEGRERTDYRQGMSLRDYFAAQALAGMCGNSGLGADVKNETIARLSYKMADAMLAARTTQPNVTPEDPE